jgi:hypothetical protein
MRARNESDKNIRGRQYSDNKAHTDTYRQQWEKGIKDNQRYY